MILSDAMTGGKPMKIQVTLQPLKYPQCQNEAQRQKRPHLPPRSSEVHPFKVNHGGALTHQYILDLSVPIQQEDLPEVPQQKDEENPE